MSTQRELNALLIRLGRAEITMKRIPLIPSFERTAENLAPLRAALIEQSNCLAELTALAVARALEGGVE